MNLKDVFEFLQEKENVKISLKKKLICGMKLTEDELNIGGNIDLSDTKITSLPNNLKVSGGLFLSYTKIASLPDNLQVGGDLDLSYTKITSLLDNFQVGGSLLL
jgi:hypothetical protein